MKQETMMFAAALIQAGGAILFAGTVIYEAIRRHLERKAQIINGLHDVWNQSTDPPKTLEEQVGPPFASPRQIRFYNERLHDLGKHWSYPIKGVPVIRVKNHPGATL
jgi:hypothetical protein